MITYSENAIALDTAEDAVIDTRVIDVDLGTAGDSEVAEKAEKRNLQTSVDSAPAEVIKKKPLYYRFIKRTFDVVFSLVVILITFIPMLILSLFVAIDTKAFPIYSQVRVGQRGEFRFYKMRTMVKDSDDLEKYFTPAQLDLWSKEHKVPDDPRITKFGAILRATSLDELPQFFNVLIGDIPQRILKTGQGGTFDSPSLFALPAKEMRTIKALFPQLKVTSGTCLRTVRNFLENLTATSAKSQAVFAKRVLDPILGFNRRVYILPIMQMFKFAKAA